MNRFPLVKTSYQTELDIPTSLTSKLSPSLSFYMPLLWIVLKASISATRGKYTADDWVASSEAVIRTLEQTGCRLSITGMEHFRHLEEPCVFIGNHMSTLETFVLPSLIQPIKDVTFVVKESLVNYPVFGSVLRSRNPIVVGRNNPRADLTAVLEGGTERLAQGQSIIIFPQSTRTTAFDPSQFNTIGIKLAKKANVPVVPFALKTDAWGNGQWLKDFGTIAPERTIHFAFAQSLRVNGQGKEEHRWIVDFIQSQLNLWA